MFVVQGNKYVYLFIIYLYIFYFIILFLQNIFGEKNNTILKNVCSTRQ